MAYFHGTSRRAWNRIKKEGLLPHKSDGALRWAELFRGGTLVQEESMYGDVFRSVYLTTDMEKATFFAGYAAKVSHSTPVVLEVSPPAPQQLLIDDAYTCPWCIGYGDGVRYEGNIPAAYIKEV